MKKSIKIICICSVYIALMGCASTVKFQMDPGDQVNLTRGETIGLVLAQASATYLNPKEKNKPDLKTIPPEAISELKLRLDSVVPEVLRMGLKNYSLAEKPATCLSDSLLEYIDGEDTLRLPKPKSECAAGGVRYLLVVAELSAQECIDSTPKIIGYMSYGAPLYSNDLKDYTVARFAGYRTGIWDVVKQKYVARISEKRILQFVGGDANVVANEVASRILGALPFTTRYSEIQSAKTNERRRPVIFLARGYMAPVLGESVSNGVTNPVINPVSDQLAASAEFVLEYIPSRWGLGVVYHGPGVINASYLDQYTDEKNPLSLQRISSVGVRGIYELAASHSLIRIVTQGVLQVEYSRLLANYSTTTKTSTWRGLGVRPELDLSVQGDHFLFGIYSGLQCDKGYNGSGKNAYVISLPIGAELGWQF